MGYSSGMLRHWVTVQNRTVAVPGRFGLDSGGVEYEDTCGLWAAVDSVKGVRALREGAVDVYGVVMIRCRYTCAINERSRIVHNGRVYQVLGETLNADPQANTLQCLAQAVIND